MSFSSQPRGLQRYSSETATQRQGKQAKQQVDEVQKLLRNMKSKKCNNSDFHELDNRLHDLKSSIKALETIVPSSQHETFEKKEFLHHFKKELEKISNVIQSLKALPEPSPVEKEVQGEEQLKVEEYQDELLEKAGMLREVQSSIIELNSMFKDLGMTVEDQGKTLDIIENFVEISEQSTKNAGEELEKASDYQKKQRCYALVLIPGVIALILILIYCFA
jgi:syntaxin 7